MCGLIRNEPGFSKTPLCIIIESARCASKRQWGGGDAGFSETSSEMIGNYDTPTWAQSNFLDKTFG